jgi:hypothetical protein
MQNSQEPSRPLKFKVREAFMREQHSLKNSEIAFKKGLKMHLRASPLKWVSPSLMPRQR